MTLPSTPESFEQFVSAAMASGDYKPVWARFVRTRFFAPMHQPAASVPPELQVQPGQKDGKPLLLVTQDQAKLANNGGDHALLSGADIVKQLSPGVAIGVILGKGVLTIPAKLVDTIRSKLEARAPATPTPPATPATASIKAAPVAPASPPPATAHNRPAPDLALPAINLSLDDATPAATPAATLSTASNAPTAFPQLSAQPNATALPDLTAALPMPTQANRPAPQPSPAAPDWDEDLVDLSLLPAATPPQAPAPAKPAPNSPLPAASEWKVVADEKPEEEPMPAQPQAPLPMAAGKPPIGPLDVKALKPRNVVHDASRLDFFVPDAWQQRTGKRSLTFFDPASQAKIEVTSLVRPDTPLEKWLELRLPEVTRDMPFLKQLGDSRPLSCPKWRGRISAMVTEFMGTHPMDQDETHYLICCYRTDSMVATVTVRVKAALLEHNRAIYQWLFEQVDIGEPAPVEPAQTSQGGNPWASQVVSPAVLGLSTRGRIGRLRFLAFSLVTYLPILFILGATRALPEKLALIAGVGAGVLILWLPIRLAVLRMHDFNLSGKWLIGFLVMAGIAGAMRRPDLVATISVIYSLWMLVLIVLPGNGMENKFGDPPTPNPMWVQIVASLYIIIPLMVLGIAASRYRTITSILSSDNSYQSQRE